MRAFLKISVMSLFFLSAPLFAQTVNNFPSVTLNRLLSNFTTWQANFAQATLNEEQKVLQKSSGTITVMRPGRFRWETTRPTHQIIIANQKTLWVYEVDLKQATRQTIQKNTINPAELLSGNANALLNQFTITMIPHRNDVVYNLFPKKPNKLFQSISMTFQNEKLKAMTIVTSIMRSSQFTFSTVKMNPVVSPTLFVFHPPTNVDVIH